MAARFSFRLEPLRRLREALEREAERTLGLALQTEGKVREEIDLLAAQHRALVESRRVETGRMVDLELWRAGEAFLVILERRQVQAYVRLREASRRVAEAREGLLDAHRDHLMLVRLKERRALQHAREQDLREMLALDELAMLRHARRTA